METFRMEKDFLGQKEVPNHAYYGIQTLRAVENFPITGYRIDSEMINALAVVKKAAALANMEIGRLFKGKAEAIIQACEEIMEGKLHDQFIVDPIQGGAGTSINMNANEVIANRGLEMMKHEKTKIYTPKTRGLNTEKAGGELTNEGPVSAEAVKKWVDDNEK